MNDHFYLTLPSDSSAKYYPNNTIARFVTKLPETIRLEGEYEMALAEIIYPQSWFNVDNSTGKYWFAFAQDKFANILLPSGYYKDGKEIQYALNALTQKDISFYYNEATEQFTLTVMLPENDVFTMSDDLKHYLGFDRSNLKLCEGRSFSSTATHTFDTNRGFNLIYVYCDVATHTIVGDTKAPLLRVCNVGGKHGDIVRHTYIHPHYVPVGRREFDTIEIAINNELGKPMPFEYGKSVVTLHFRRRHERPILSHAAVGQFRGLFSG